MRICNNCNNSRNTRRSVLAFKDNVELGDCRDIFYPLASGHIYYTLWSIEHTQFVMIHSYPNGNFMDFVSETTKVLQNCDLKPTVVIGDFNIDMPDNDRL